MNRQWQQAREMLAAGKIAESVPLLASATAALHPEATFHLGSLHMFGLIEAADKKRGLQLIQKAADLGQSAAFYQLAVHELSKPDKTPDWQYANECLWRSAQSKYPPALRSLAIHWSSSPEQSMLALGTLCLEYAAEGGDMVSLGLLMHRLRHGVGCPANPQRANAINTLLLQTDLPVENPMAQVNPELAPPENLLALPSLPKPDLAGGFWKTDVTVLSESPWVAIADNVLNQEECHLVYYSGGPQVERSITADPDGNLVKVQLRTSSEMVFHDAEEDISLLMIQRRMAGLVNKTPAYSEPLHLLRYENGQEYRPHRDYLPQSLISSLDEGGPGQRDSTVIVYLNEIAHGGETEFLELDKKIAPKTGRVLAFNNLHPDGTPDTRTLHAGLPVRSGTKWIATMWLHQGIFRR
ncbi:MAG: 2OG-Fe(II) oxygenase [Arenimonas sp.]